MRAVVVVREAEASSGASIAREGCRNAMVIGRRPSGSCPSAAPGASEAIVTRREDREMGSRRPQRCEQRAQGTGVAPSSGERHRE